MTRVSQQRDRRIAVLLSWVFLPKTHGRHRMRTLFRVLLPCLAASALGACAGTHDRLPEARYTMTERQSVPLAPKVNLTYEGADDSRCPDDARCIWAGQVAYRFTLRIDSVAQSFY